MSSRGRRSKSEGINYWWCFDDDDDHYGDDDYDDHYYDNIVYVIHLI
jgi:hypothetical protein